MSPSGLESAILIDSHAHLDSAFFRNDLDRVIEEARQSLRAVLTIGSGGSPRSAEEAVALAREHDFLFATVGLHPHDARRWNPALESTLERLGQEPETVAIGECGLDFYYDKSPREDQRRAFRAQLRLARRLALPVVLHIRDAWPEALGILDEEGLPAAGGVVHCFTGGEDEARASLARGLYLGVTGIATYPHADALRRALSGVPLERLLVETDSPFLPAQAVKRERPNRPALVRHVAIALAEILGRPFEEVARHTADNTARLFRLPAGAGLYPHEAAG